MSFLRGYHWFIPDCGQCVLQCKHLMNSWSSWISRSSLWLTLTLGVFSERKPHVQNITCKAKVLAEAPASVNPSSLCEPLPRAVCKAFFAIYWVVPLLHSGTLDTSAGTRILEGRSCNGKSKLSFYPMQQSGHYLYTVPHTPSLSTQYLYPHEGNGHL